MNQLLRFAETVNLPVLVAWKFRGLWMLVDVTHFEKRITAYHLSWEIAMRENLMGILFGETVVELEEHFRFILEAELNDAEAVMVGYFRNERMPRLSGELGFTPVSSR